MDQMGNNRFWTVRPVLYRTMGAGLARRLRPLQVFLGQCERLNGFKPLPA